MSNVKQHLISIATTFVTAFLVTVSMAVQVPEFSFSKQTLVAVALAGIIAGLRAIFKFIVEFFTTSTSN